MDASRYPGFRKLDLHIHTPESACYGDKTVLPEQIVSAALDAGLDAIAITDHNTSAGMGDVREAARGSSLCVFPAMEVTTRSGHFIAVFDLNTPLSVLEDFLDDIGIGQGARGDGAIAARDEAVDVIQKAVGRGGLVIAAHIERWPSGFTEADCPRNVKMHIHSNQCLSALEITIPQNRGLWNSGGMRGYPRKCACIQSSDAHSLNDIGRRPIFVRMERVCLEELKTIFTSYPARIAFPDELAGD